MGFFDTITDIFTGAPAKEAAARTQQYLAQQQAENAARYAQLQQQGLAALNQGQAGALGSLTNAYDVAKSNLYGGAYPALNAFSGYGTLGANALTGYGNQATGALTQYGGSATGALTDAQRQGLAALQGGLNTATGAFDPLLAAAQRYGGNTQQAQSAQADAMGLNGPEGIQRALASFQATPGYQFQQNEALNQAARAYNAAGMGASGNALQELSDRAGNIAAQQWPAYLAGLQGIQSLYAPLEQAGLSGYGTGQLGLGQQALTGGANIANFLGQTGSNLASTLGQTGANLATSYGQTGGRLADLYGTTGQGLANLYNTLGINTGQLAGQLLGTAPSNVYGNTAGNIVNYLQGLGGQQTNYNQSILGPYTQTYSDIANAELGGSKNLWGLGLSLAQLGAGGGLGGLTGAFLK